jgi:tetratricopeptide (TPR) repeat protein
MNPTPILKKVKKKATVNILSQNNYINWSGVKLGGFMSKFTKILLCSIIVFAILLILPINCARKHVKASAYQRFGITNPLTDTLAERELASAYNLLYSMQFKNAFAIYETIVKKYPTSAEAHLGLSMAYRYLGKPNEALFEGARAFVLDSNAVGVLLNYADLLTPFRGAKLKENLSDSVRSALAIFYYEKALKSNNPLRDYAHLGLWNVYFIMTNQSPMARAQMLELGKSNYFPPSLQDFAYNILITAEPDAIIFTNGDNDTYPLYCLQEYQNVRRDVSIVNINLLNAPNIAMLMRDSLKVPISYTDSELVKMKPIKSPKGFWIYPAGNLIANIVKNARKVKRPVYFAVTVDRTRIPYYVNFFINEGLLMKMADVKTQDSIDIDKVTQNLRKNYRLKNIGQKENWQANFSPLTRAVSMLAFNYAAVGSQVAQYYEKQGNKKEAVYYYKWVYNIIEQIGRTDLLTPLKNKINALK